MRDTSSHSGIPTVPAAEVRRNVLKTALEAVDVITRISDLPTNLPLAIRLHLAARRCSHLLLLVASIPFLNRLLLLSLRLLSPFDRGLLLKGESLHGTICDAVDIQFFGSCILVALQIHRIA